MRNRQIILPATTLVLCLVLMVGIGFAITTSVSNTTNSIAADANTIELYTDNGAQTVADVPVFSEGTLVYSTDSVNGDVTYNVASGQTVNMHATAYLKATKTGPIEVVMTGVSGDLFEKFDVTIGDKTVTLNAGNGFTATFETGTSVDVTTQQQVKIVGTTAEYSGPDPPSGLTGISVKFTLTPSP